MSVNLNELTQTLVKLQDLFLSDICGIYWMRSCPFLTKSLVKSEEKWHRAWTAKGQDLIQYLVYHRCHSKTDQFVHIYWHHPKTVDMLKGYRLKPCIALNGKPIELRCVTCHMGSQSVTCHPTRVNAPRHNLSQPGRYSIYLPRKDGRLSRPM